MVYKISTNVVDIYGQFFKELIILKSSLKHFKKLCEK